jgi:hypothetical protein
MAATLLQIERDLAEPFLVWCNVSQRGGALCIRQWRFVSDGAGRAYGLREPLHSQSTARHLKRASALANVAPDKERLR